MTDPTIAWNDLLVRHEGEGRLSLLSETAVPLGVVTIAPPAPWVLASSDLDADSLDLLWTSDAGELRVRHAWGALWHITVEQPAATETSGVPLPLLSLEAAADTPTPWLWGAGSQARAVGRAGRSLDCLRPHQLAQLSLEEVVAWPAGRANRQGRQHWLGAANVRCGAVGYHRANRTHRGAIAATRPGGRTAAGSAFTAFIRRRGPEVSHPNRRPNIG